MFDSKTTRFIYEPILESTVQKVTITRIFYINYSCYKYRMAYKLVPYELSDPTGQINALIIVLT